MTTTSPFSMSRTKRAPMMSRAQVSEHRIGGRRARPAPAGGCRAGRARRSASCWSGRRRRRRPRSGSSASMKRSTKRSRGERATRCRMTSVSEVDWQIAPLRISSRRSVRPLVRLPLWATAKPPTVEFGEQRLDVAQDRLAGGGVAGVADGAMLPGRRSMTSRSEKVSPTRPRRRSEWKRLPSKVTMPAASWPRCCRACRPSAVIAAASGWPKMPKTPHSSRSVSAVEVEIVRRAGIVAVTARRSSLSCIAHVVARSQPRRHRRSAPLDDGCGAGGGHGGAVFGLRRLRSSARSAARRPARAILAVGRQEVLRAQRFRIALSGSFGRRPSASCRRTSSIGFDLASWTQTGWACPARARRRT